MTTLLVGHGLLGSRVRRALERAGDDVRVARVPWRDPDAALAAVLREATRAAQAETSWRLVWSAGAGVVSTDPGSLRGEVDLVRRVAAGLGTPPGAVLLASSAGGVYAGSSAPPFTEEHAVHPLADYGRAKLDIEAAMTSLTDRGSRVAVGRFANLYGPGQDLAKPQGLVSQLCRSRITGEPLTVYVPADTMRDYIYVDDAAAVAAAMLDRVGTLAAGASVVKIVGSGRATTISGLVGATTRALRRRPPVVYASRPGTGQVRDLRLRSVVWTDLDALVATPLVVGLRAAAEDVADQHRAARLVRS